jgi:hypothetical protein
MRGVVARRFAERKVAVDQPGEISAADRVER